MWILNFVSGDKMVMEKIEKTFCFLFFTCEFWAREPSLVIQVLFTETWNLLLHALYSWPHALSGDWALSVFSSVLPVLTRSFSQNKLLTFSDFGIKSRHSNYVGVVLTGVVACTCNPGILDAEFRNSVGSMPVGDNSPSVWGWIVWPYLSRHKERSLTKHWDLTET